MVVGLGLCVSSLRNVLAVCCFLLLSYSKAKPKRVQIVNFGQSCRCSVPTSARRTTCVCQCVSWNVCVVCNVCVVRVSICMWSGFFWLLWSQLPVAAAASAGVFAVYALIRVRQRSPTNTKTNTLFVYFFVSGTIVLCLRWPSGVLPCLCIEWYIYVVCRMCHGRKLRRCECASTFVLHC